MKEQQQSTSSSASYAVVAAPAPKTTLDHAMSDTTTPEAAIMKQRRRIFSGGGGGSIRRSSNSSTSSLSSSSSPKQLHHTAVAVQAGPPTGWNACMSGVQHAVATASSRRISPTNSPNIYNNNNTVSNGYGVGLTSISPTNSPVLQQSTTTSSRVAVNNSCSSSSPSSSLVARTAMPPPTFLMSDDANNTTTKKSKLPEQRKSSSSSSVVVGRQSYFHHRRIASNPATKTTTVTTTTSHQAETTRAQGRRRKKLEKSVSWNTGLLRDLHTIKSNSNSNSDDSSSSEESDHGDGGDGQDNHHNGNHNSDQNGGGNGGAIRKKKSKQKALRRTMSMVYTPVCALNVNTANHHTNINTTTTMTSSNSSVVVNNNIIGGIHHASTATFSLPPPPTKSSMKPSRSFTNIHNTHTHTQSTCNNLYVEGDLNDENDNGNHCNIQSDDNDRDDDINVKPKLKRTDSILKRIEWSPNSSQRGQRQRQQQQVPDNNSMKRNVSFSSTSIREYPVTLGDHPSCSHGPPLSLGWEYFEDEHTLPLDQYEKTRQGSRKKHWYELLLSGSDRKNILVDVVGADANEIEEAIEGVQRVQMERRATDMFSEFSAIEEFLEGVGRAFKGLQSGSNATWKKLCSCWPSRNGNGKRDDDDADDVS
eukprot:CAMPEP_0196808288 /NCGR_PEP_ID=MMETSP1362-20130617/8279_1 /TAXON_ID=163516 /ORGANISM="Leptocylindrus danicus, Strain CCMP1856" /LENGTH=645 /DNA_ID=CAMNT_0042182573 /DNA_START=74 /DNA_END=2011 /DNA_ORIENTATION=+